MELYELQKHSAYAVEFIDSYLQTLGNFFYKYIKRNLAHIEAEAEACAGAGAGLGSVACRGGTQQAGSETSGTITAWPRWR